VRRFGRGIKIGELFASVATWGSMPFAMPPNMQNASLGGKVLPLREVGVDSSPVFAKSRIRFSGEVGGLTRGCDDPFNSH